MFRSESCSLFRMTKSRTAIYGEKYCRSSAPGLWNKLSNNIEFVANKEKFYKVLKSYLFAGLSVLFRNYCLSVFVYKPVVFCELCVYSQL